MDTPEDAYALTQYGAAWDEFEDHLARFLGYLAIPTIYETVRLHAPTGDGDERHVDVEGRFQNFADRSAEAIDVRIAGQRSVLFSVGADVEGVPDAARAICSQLRHEWDVAHPSLLVAEPLNASALTMTRLGLPAPERVPDENVEHQRLAARRAVQPGEVGEELSIEMNRERVELVLKAHCGQVAADLDGDYPVEVDGVRFYVSLDDTQPAIRLWRSVVSSVRSRRAAVIEANYLNRTYPLTSWVLWGSSLLQEIYVPASPFSADLLTGMLDRFAEHYSANVSSLRLRLSEDD